MIKIVIPTDSNKGLDDSVAIHFGRCNTYTFLDENRKIVKIINNTSEHMGGVGLPPELMKNHGANILLCHDLGPKALDLCNELGISIYVGQAKTVKDMFKEWKDNNLKKAKTDDVCKEHKQ